MSDARAERLTEFVSTAVRDRASPNLVPKDAATLIVIDRATATPRVLMGKRHAGHKFMPGKFVFPGGRLEAEDRGVPASGTLDPRVANALSARLRRPSLHRGRALAVAAIRETYEETGLVLGCPGEAPRSLVADATWDAFRERGLLPNLAALAFIGRAITPPRRPRRFDTRFFAVDRTAVAAEAPGFTGPDKELVELVWVGIGEARDLDLPPITLVMLEELEHRIASGFGHQLPVPFYYERRRRFLREEL